jgi:iron complex outermembrane receptor protein
LPNAPDVSFNGLGRYEWPMFGGTMAAQLDFNYVDKRSLNTIDHPALIPDSYFVLNSKLSYVTADGRWQADLWVKNLNDEDYIQTGFDTSTVSGLNIEVAAPPRWVGGTITYRF